MPEENKIQKSFSNNLLDSLKEANLPAKILKSVGKAVGSLIESSASIPKAWLDGQAEIKKAQALAKINVIDAIGKISASKVTSDPNLIERATDYHINRLLIEQTNREEVTRLAIEQLVDSSIEEDSEKEIDDDWLTFFSKAVENKSEKDFQILFSKILAGEIKRPGSFNYRTIHTLSMLTQEEGELFQNLCNLSFAPINSDESFSCVFTDPIGNPSLSDLKSYGLTYYDLKVLEDAGLIFSDDNFKKSLTVNLFIGEFNVGGEKIKLICPPEKNISRREDIGVIILTKQAVQLRNIVEITKNDSYNKSFIEWVESKLGLEYVKEEK